MNFRIGHGYDVHKLQKGRELILGGVHIENDGIGLLGHSDADVLAHAVSDALLGAAALGDIGKHFPDTDDAYKNADSMVLLSKVCDLLKKNGYSVVRDLCGHGVGLEFHEEPEVCHFGRKGTGMLLVPGMVFTIEPMINMGTWQVFIDEEDGWTVVTEDELPSAQWEHTFLMTETGLEILSY